MSNKNYDLELIMLFITGAIMIFAGIISLSLKYGNETIVTEKIVDVEIEMT